ncbi:MAG: hypothetical protein HN742_31985 [Lentisphaerae bacterium]|jgi:hypothetical protein|nr:hypothetical protein [Lentisphaerota bacterium]MBT4818387.1 hypothetical protein [Lentisphaerota bacterium]MBT5611588.1 hypothetical protein [Lentisphaerota bacterium]MBT7061687.1 hypothetical protein [Lentisphaerota bacterium]MBT7846533.1 hypothetical protein [Lentisphaerota bacterium]
MTTTRLLSYAACFALVVSFCCAPASGQAKKRGALRITDLDLQHKDSPEFQAMSNPRATREYRWYQITVEYEARGGDRGWLDEVELEWSVILSPKSSSKPFLLKRTVTYVDVETAKGATHHAVVYLRPAFIRRYYGTDRINKNDIGIYVRTKVNGESSDTYREAKSKDLRGTWWEAREPRVHIRENELMTRDETPFAPLDYDFYEHLKPRR